MTAFRREKRAKKNAESPWEGRGKARKVLLLFIFFFSFCNFKCFPLRSSQNLMLTLALQARVRFVSDHKIFFFFSIKTKNSIKRGITQHRVSGET